MGNAVQTFCTFGGLERRIDLFSAFQNVASSVPLYQLPVLRSSLLSRLSFERWNSCKRLGQTDRQCSASVRVTAY
jgi:hypothetical protein